MKIERDKNFTFTGLSDKESKNLAIFDLIKAKNIISRTDISKDTGINMVSVSNYIKSFMDKGLLYDRGPDVSTGGRKPELLEITTGDWGALGININKGGADAVLTDLRARSVEKRHSAVGDIPKMAGELCESAMTREIKIKAVGIGFEGGESESLLKGVGDAVNAPVFLGGAWSDGLAVRIRGCLDPRGRYAAFFHDIAHANSRSQCGKLKLGH